MARVLAVDAESRVARLENVVARATKPPSLELLLSQQLALVVADPPPSLAGFASEHAEPLVSSGSHIHGKLALDHQNLRTHLLRRSCCCDVFFVSLFHQHLRSHL
jgi:hypothetical protein